MREYTNSDSRPVSAQVNFLYTVPIPCDPPFRGPADFRPDDSLSEILPALRAGTNIVSTSFHPLLHPPSTPEPMRSQVLEACAEGNSSIFVSGIDPGWIIDVLPIFLASMVSNITEVRAQEIANYAGYDQPDAVRFLCGFGQPMEYDAPILTDWALMQVWAL